MHRIFHITYTSLLILFGILAPLSGSRTLYYFFILLLIVRVLSYWLVVHYEDNVYIRLFSAQSVISAGDAITLNYRISNASYLPIAHAHVSFEIDENVAVTSAQKHLAILDSQETLPFEKQYVFEYRGYYSLGKVTVDVFDPMMFHRRTVSFDKVQDIVVYPRIVSLATDWIVPQTQNGSLKVTDKSQEDRTHILNVRDYVRGDSLKNIHWKLSAKRDVLMTREYHKTMSERLMVYLDGFCGNSEGEITLKKEERMVSFCASFVKACTQKGLQYTLQFNNGLNTSFDAQSAADFNRVMEHLVAFKSDSSEDFGSFLSKSMQSSVVYEQFVVITPHISEQLRSFLARRVINYKLYTFNVSAGDERLLGAKDIEKIMSGGGQL
jgi:uncharacterized protein (DUF58 family)